MLNFTILLLIILFQNTLPFHGMEEIPRKGIDHIDAAHKYNIEIGHGQWWTMNFGYHYTGDNIYHNYRYVTADPRYHESLDKQNCRTITTDIREAILDNDRFMLALDEGRFGDAWQMGLANEQGKIWKKRVAIKAKSKVEKLAKQSVIEGDPLKLNQAIAIVHQFHGLPLYGELRNLLEETKQKTMKLLDQYSVDRRVDAEAEIRVLRNITSQLFG